MTVKLIKNGNIVNVAEAQSGNFRSQGYVPATDADIKKAQNKSAFDFAYATPGAEGQASRDLAEQGARRAVFGSSIPGIGSTSIIDQPGADDLSEINGSKKDITGAKSTMATDDDDEFGVGRDLVDDYVERLDFGETDEGKAAKAEKDRLAKEKGETTEADEAQITEAGAVAGSEFDRAIEKAREDKRQGEGRNLVSAAKAGGLDASAWVGISALLGEDLSVKGFQGIGGKLEQMATVYDRNIADLQERKVRAINAAKIAERRAIASGKRQDWADARTMYQDALKEYNDATTMILNKEKVLQSYTKFMMDGLDSSFDRATKILEVGGSVEDITDKDREDIVRFYGEDFLGNVETLLEEQKKADEFKDDIASANAILGIMSKIEVGKKFKIGDSEYEGMKTVKPNTKVYKETTANGEVVIVEIDMDTKEISVTGTGVFKKVPGKKGDKDTETEKLSFDEWLSALEKQNQSNYWVDNPKVLSKLKKSYNEYLAEDIEFTKQEIKALAAEKLLDANNTEKLKYLRKIGLIKGEKKDKDEDKVEGEDIEIDPDFL